MDKIKMHDQPHLFRFFGRPSPSNSQEWILDDDEVRHAVRVLRLKEKDRVELMDGCGRCVVGHISLLQTREVVVEVEASELGKVACEVNTRPLIDVYLGALKPSVMDDLIPVLCELGVASVTVFRGSGRENAFTKDKVVARWQRILKTSVKQCKRLWLPKLEVFADLDRCLAPLDSSQTAKFACFPGSKLQSLSALQGACVEKSRVALVIGSESGFSDSEVQLLQKLDFISLSLGSHILRAYTAAVTAVGLLGQVCLPRDE